MERVRGSMIGTPGVTPEQLIQNIKDLASNNCKYVRYQLVNPIEQFEGRELPEAEQRQYFNDDLAKLAQVLAATPNTKYIVDFHTPPGGTDQTHPKRFQRMFLNRPDLQKRFFEQWDLLTNIKSKNIIAYDLLNEPAGPPVQVWTIQEDVGKAIRKKGINTPVVISTPHGNPTLKIRPSALKNVWYTAHLYPGSTYQKPETNPSILTDAYFNKYMKNLNDFKKANPTTRILIGETGCLRWAGQGKNQVNWLRAYIRYLEARNYDWCFHAWREYHGWSIELPADTSMGPVPIDNRRLRMMARAWKNGVI